MDSDTAEEFLVLFEQIECPFISDVDASYLSHLLLAPSQHRMRILSWLFSKIHCNIEHEIEYFNQNPEAFKGSIEIDKDVQLLTDIGSSVGICLPTDYSLIRGKAPAEAHVALWRNLLTIAHSLSESEDPIDVRMEFVNQMSDTMFRACDMTSVLSSTVRILSPAIAKEIEISHKTTKYSTSSAMSTTNDLSEKLEILQTELEKQLNILQNLRQTNPSLSTTPDDPSLLAKLNRSFAVTLNDLNQLQTTFLQIFDNHFQPYCDKSPLQFSNLGSTIKRVGDQLASLLKFLENMKTLKMCDQRITEKEMELDRL